MDFGNNHNLGKIELKILKAEKRTFLHSDNKKKP